MWCKKALKGAGGEHRPRSIGVVGFLEREKKKEIKEKREAKNHKRNCKTPRWMEN